MYHVIFISHGKLQSFTKHSSAQSAQEAFDKLYTNHPLSYADCGRGDCVGYGHNPYLGQELFLIQDGA